MNPLRLKRAALIARSWPYSAETVCDCLLLSGDDEELALSALQFGAATNRSPLEFLEALARCKSKSPVSR